MRRSLTLFVIAIALLMGVSSRIASADDLTRTVLMKKDLDGSPGKEVTIFIAQYRPGGPGQEFIHVISGEGIMDETGKPPVEMKPGVQLYFASDPKNPSYVHEATDIGKTEGMKLLVVLITEKGQPLAYPAK